MVQVLFKQSCKRFKRTHRKKKIDLPKADKSRATNQNPFIEEDGYICKSIKMSYLGKLD